MSSAQSHCRLCAKPFARSLLVCIDDEVVNIKQKMLLVNVDVSAPSPLPRGVCHSCLCLLEKTAKFLHQVSAAQHKLSEIYQENKNLVEDSDNMSDDFDFGVKQEPQDVKEVEIETEPRRHELPKETAPTSTKPFENPAVNRKRNRPKKELKHNNSEKKSDINVQEPLDIAVAKKIQDRPRKKHEIESKDEEKEHPKDEPKLEKARKVVSRKHVCHCGKAWPYPSQLKQHQIIHTERTRDFYCHVCGKSYLESKALRDHLLTHEAKRYKCEHCDKAFHAPSLLKKHAAQHPLAC